MPETRNIEFFIAGRISSSGSGGGRDVMVRIAMVSVAISLAVMIISLAVIFGFKRSITEKLAGFGSHVQIVNLDGNTSLETAAIHRSGALEEALGGLKNFGEAHVYAVKGGIIKTAGATQGIMLKGVDSGFDWSFFADCLVDGELPRVGDSVRMKDILISRSLSRLLEIGVDDRVEILFVQNGRAPRRDRFKIAGIYSSGMEEMDVMAVMTDIRNVQRLNGWSGDEITGYEVTTTDFKKIDDFAAGVYDIVLEMEEESGDILMVTDIRSRFPNLFDWLKAHNVNAAVIIVIMLMVAFLNMVSALLIILLQRTRMIGILKALGMNNASLQRMFVIRSGFIVLGGMLWGNAAGLGLCVLQKYTGLLKLNEAGYFLSEVPVSLGWGWILTLNTGVFAVILLLLILPTNIVSRIMPDTTMRYQ